MKIIYSLFILFFAISQIVAQSLNNSKDEVVYTPSGPALKSQVHFVDSKHHLNMKDNKIQIVENKTDAVSQEFKCSVINRKNNIISNSKSRIPKSIAPVDNGWITYAQWDNSTVTPISYFSTNWIVPAPPTTVTDNQTIFLFNGLCPDTWAWILQPVLQWGVSAAGGGSYWAISNWYVDDSLFFCDTLLKVSPGTNLQGVMKLTSDSASNYSYNSYFVVDSSGTSLPGCNLQINSIPILTWAFQTMEVYNVAQCTDYPADTIIRLTNIEIKTDSIYPSIKWDPQDAVSEYGQNTTIVSNDSINGEVDIRFHSPCLSTGIRDLFSLRDKISLFPDPASNYITIEVPPRSTIEISNMQGQLIEAVFANERNIVNIDISGFASGMYIVKTKTETSIILNKFIKE